MRCLALDKLFTLRNLSLFATYYDQQKEYKYESVYSTYTSDY